MTKEVKRILNCYKGENPEILSKLRRLLNHGNLRGSGKMVILPVDQGFEHGPDASFSTNPDAYDPEYHFQLALESGCTAYAAPYGFLAAGAKKFSKKLPLILKVNNSDSLYKNSKRPISSLTSGVEEALQLGCVGIGFTIYPGSEESKKMYEEFSTLAKQARRAGLLLVVWSYPRGGNLSKEGETAIDVVSYAAHIAAQLGAHIIKVKPPTDYLEQISKFEIIKEGKNLSYRVIGKEKNIPITTLSDRISHIVKSSFNGRRIVIFSGGVAKEKTEVLSEIAEIAKGGGFGSIVGRNVFQRSKSEALDLLREIMDIYKNVTYLNN